MVEEERADLLGGPTTSPTPGSPRWRQSREENRKWETAAAERRGAGMEAQMEGRADGQTHRRTDREAIPGPRPVLQSEKPHAALPQDRVRGAAQPVPPREGPKQGGKTRRGCLGA